MNFFVDLPDFSEGLGDKFLRSEPGVNGHHQDKLKAVKHLTEQAGGRRGVQGNAGLFPQSVNLLDRPVEVGRGFLVDDDRVGARAREALDKIFRRLHHQVSLEEKAGDRPQGFESDRPERDVWDKAAVHDVNLDAIDAGGFNGFHLLAEAREIGREDRGRNFDQKASSFQAPGAVIPATMASASS